MNDNLDDWLNSLGFNSATTPSTENTDTTAVPVPVEPTPPEPPEPSLVNITASDLDDILADNGFTIEEPSFDEAEEIETTSVRASGFTPEETHNGEDDETEWEDENNEEDEDVVTTATNNEGLIDLHFVGSDPGSQVGDISINPDTGEATIVTPNRTETLGSRDLDAEEDADLEEATVPSVNTEGQSSLLPPNSPTLLIDTSTSRFSGAEWYNEIQKARIIVAGIGGIGSNVVFQLARMSPASLFMYDDDIVEAANMSGQLYCQSDVGKTKVDAMADMIRSYTSMRSIFAINEKFTLESEAGDIMICGFDSMRARRTFFEKWCTHVQSKPEEERKNCLLLDGRLSIDTLQVFCLTGDNDWAISEYRNNYLFSDEDADATVCSMKQTTYLACMIGSVIVNLFTNFIASTLNPIIPYDLPFFTEYDAQNMIFKTVK